MARVTWRRGWSLMSRYAIIVASGLFPLLLLADGLQSALSARESKADPQSLSTDAMRGLIGTNNNPSCQGVGGICGGANTTCASYSNKCDTVNGSCTAGGSGNTYSFTASNPQYCKSVAGSTGCTQVGYGTQLVCYVASPCLCQFANGTWTCADQNMPKNKCTPSQYDIGLGPVFCPATPNCTP
jgi:hypothetical protein